MTSADQWQQEQEKYKSGHFRIGFLSELVVRVAPELQGTTVIDIGGGPGALRDVLSAKGARVFVVDIYSELKSDVILHDLREPWSVEKCDWPPADVVVLSGVLEYLEDWTNVMSAVRALLRPGGTCIATYVNFERVRIRKDHPWWVGQRPLSRVVRSFSESRFAIERTVALWQLKSRRATRLIGRDYCASSLSNRVSAKIGRLMCDQFVLVMRLI